jgi:hypothetical protein
VFCRLILQGLGRRCCFFDLCRILLSDLVDCLIALTSFLQFEYVIATIAVRLAAVLDGC